MKIRLIIAVGNGDKEQVAFVDAEETCPASDFFVSSMKVTYDEIIEADLPSIFPTNRTLTSD